MLWCYYVMYTHTHTHTHIYIYIFKKNEMGWACGAYGGGEGGVQVLGGETRGKETTGET